MCLLLSALTVSAQEYYNKAWEEGTKDSDSHKKLMEILDELEKRDFLITYDSYRGHLQELYTRFLFANFTVKEINQYFQTKNKRITNPHKRYSDFLALWKELRAKKDKTELEEYAFLYCSTRARESEYRYDENYQKIRDDYKQYQRTVKR